MKELELLHDQNFREKVRIVESVIATLPLSSAASARARMLQSWTREQWITYHAAIAEDQATLRNLAREQRIEHLTHAIEAAGLEYDGAL